MTVTLKNMAPRLEPHGRPVEMLEPRSCDECERPQSRYRTPAETLCSGCASKHPPTPAAAHVCSSCGRFGDYDERHGLCGWCVVEARGRVATRCETCDRVFGLLKGGVSGSTRECSSCRDRRRMAAMTPEEYEAYRVRKLAQQRECRKRKPRRAA